MNRELIPHPLSVHSYLLRVRGFLDLYMESGILDHLNIAPLNEDTHKPSQLYYGSDIDAIRGTGAALGKLKVEEISDGVLNGDNRDEGESSALGCDPKVTEITVTNDAGDSETFVSSPAAFCPAVFARKEVQSKYPASFFSGKLRLMVQAMYGSKRTDYKMSETFENLSPLSVENGSLTWTYTNNNGLFSGRNYEYFMIRVNGDGVYAQKLKAKGAGKKLQEYLQNNSITGARERRYETYLLSMLFYDANESWTKIGDSGDAYSHGSPWYYGWSWNMDGTQAEAVTIQKKDDDSEPKIWEATAFSLSLSETTAETVADGRLTATMTTEEATQEFSFGLNTDMVWFPNDLGAGMRPFIPHEPFDGGPDAGDIDVPMYVVYDYANDKFDTIRFKRVDLGTGDDVLGGTVTWDGGSAFHTPDPCTNSGCEWKSRADSATEKGFYIEDYSDWSGVDKTGTNVDIQAKEARVLGGGDKEEGGTNNFGRECSSPAGQSGPDGFEVYMPGEGSDIDLSGDFNLQTLFVVPLFDADAVYLGFWNDFDGTISASKTTPEAEVLARVNWYQSPGDNTSPFLEQTQAEWSWDKPTGSSVVRWVLKRSAENAGNINKSNESGHLHNMEIRYYASGQDQEIVQMRFSSSEALEKSVRFPGCVNAHFQAFEDQRWQSDSFDKGGYGDFFDPVLFPEPQTVPPIISRSSATFQSYHATQNPGSGDTPINDGTYPYDEIDDTLFSYVGFA